MLDLILIMAESGRHPVAHVGEDRSKSLGQEETKRIPRSPGREDKSTFLTPNPHRDEKHHELIPLNDYKYRKDGLQRIHANSSAETSGIGSGIGDSLQRLHTLSSTETSGYGGGYPSSRGGSFDHSPENVGTQRSPHRSGGAYLFLGGSLDHSTQAHLSPNQQLNGKLGYSESQLNHNAHRRPLSGEIKPGYSESHLSVNRGFRGRSPPGGRSPPRGSHHSPGRSPPRGFDNGTGRSLHRDHDNATGRSLPRDHDNASGRPGGVPLLRNPLRSSKKSRSLDYNDYNGVAHIDSRTFCESEDQYTAAPYQSGPQSPPDSPQLESTDSIFHRNPYKKPKHSEYWKSWRSEERRASDILEERESSGNSAEMEDITFYFKTAKRQSAGNITPAETPLLSRRESLDSLGSGTINYLGGFKSNWKKERKLEERRQSTGSGQFLGLDTTSNWLRWSHDRRASYKRRIRLIEERQRELEQARVSTPVMKARQESVMFVTADLEDQHIIKDELQEQSERIYEQMAGAVPTTQKRHIAIKDEPKLTQKQLNDLSAFWEHSLFVNCRYLGLLLSTIGVLIALISLSNQDWYAAKGKPSCP